MKAGDDWRWSWKGAWRKRFRWSRLRFEYGRPCFDTDANGNTRRSAWEWERS